MTKPDFCPHCKANLQGPAIPQQYIDQGYYAPGETHYSRRIGIYDTTKDMTVGYRCPDCDGYWSRFPKGGDDE